MTNMEYNRLRRVPIWPCVCCDATWRCQPASPDWIAALPCEASLSAPIAARADRRHNSTRRLLRKMCPLRYILLLLSLLVAMIGFSQAMSEQEKISYAPQEEEEEYDEHGEVVVKAANKQSSFRTLVDMLNGKYLYDAWKASQLRVKTA